MACLESLSQSNQFPAFFTCLTILRYYDLAWKVVRATRSENNFTGDTLQIMCTRTHAIFDDAPLRDLRWRTMEGSDHGSRRAPWRGGHWNFGTVIDDLKRKSRCCYRSSRLCKLTWAILTANISSTQVTTIFRNHWVMSNGISAYVLSKMSLSFEANVLKTPAFFPAVLLYHSRKIASLDIRTSEG